MIRGVFTWCFKWLRRVNQKLLISSQIWSQIWKAFWYPVRGLDRAHSRKKLKVKILDCSSKSRILYCTLDIGTSIQVVLHFPYVNIHICAGVVQICVLHSILFVPTLPPINSWFAVIIQQPVIYARMNILENMPPFLGGGMSVDII